MEWQQEAGERHKRTIRGDENIPDLNGDVGHIAESKLLELKQLRSVYFAVCKLYLNKKKMLGKEITNFQVQEGSVKTFLYPSLKNNLQTSRGTRNSK